MLPKFLLADNSQDAPDTIYVVHTESPRFIVESDIEDFWENQVVHWIDDDPQNEDFVAELLEQASDFLESEFDNQEDLYDNEMGSN